MTPYIPTAIRRPFAGVFHQPPANPPLGELPGDDLLAWPQADRERYLSTGGKVEYVEDAEGHDAAVEQLVSALAGERTRIGPESDHVGGDGR